MSVSCLLTNRFSGAGTVQRVASDTRISANAFIGKSGERVFPHFTVNDFFEQTERVSEMVCVSFRSVHKTTAQGGSAELITRFELLQIASNALWLIFRQLYER
jgi:hypothetical protein